MPRPQTILISFLVALVATGSAIALAQNQGPARASAAPKQQPASRKPVQPLQQFPPGRMDELLRLWEGQSAKLKTLEVDIYRIDQDRAWGDEAQFSGHAAFKTPDLAYVDYKKVKMVADPKDKNKFVAAQNKDGTFVATPFETILCTGVEVWQYRYDVKQVYIFPLNKDARRRALDEGPLPFLFRMRVGDAKQKYDMARPWNEKSSLVEILPRLKEDKEVFSTAWVWLDRQFLLPRRIKLISPDKGKFQDFILTNIRANQPVKDQYFVGIKPGLGWKMQINPAGEEKGAANPNRPRRNGDPQAADRPDARMAPR